MKKFTVHGELLAHVTIEVEAENHTDAIDTAYNLFGGVTNYAGNGGCDKLIGVRGNDETIECYDEPCFNDAEEIE